MASFDGIAAWLQISCPRWHQSLVYKVTTGAEHLIFTCLRILVVLGYRLLLSPSFSTIWIVQDKELGRGTYGRVIQATHRGTGRQFACKVVHVTRMEPRQVSKLYSEVSVLRELDHPHIVRMRQVFYSKVPAALPQLVDGGTLVSHSAFLLCM